MIEINEKKVPLIEQSRPKTIEEISLDLANLHVVKKLLQDPERFPHLILTGPPGVGKTSLARILAKELLGELTDFNYLELNASFDRGINTIRDTLKTFVSSSAFMKLGAPRTKYKIVFLDEACSLTTDAQLALRNLMETYVDKARFIFSCNNYNKIHEALISRSYTIRFIKLSPEALYEKVKSFLEESKIDFCPEKVLELCKNADGDFRKVYNYLNLPTTKKVDVLNQTCNLIVNFLRYKKEEDFKKIKRNLYDLKDQKDLFFEQLIARLLPVIEELPNSFFVLDRLSKADFAIALGANFTLQITGFLGSIVN